MDDSFFARRSGFCNERTALAVAGDIEICVEAMTEGSLGFGWDYRRDTHGLDPSSAPSG